jgi:hypothetical protein
MSLKSLVEKFINYDCEVEIGSNFLFYPDGVIVFTLGEDKEDSILWKQFLKEHFNFTLTKENLFTMSILHELGHYYTIEYFTAEEWNEPELETEDNTALQMAHFQKPHELIATEWAIAYYNANPKLMRAWNHRFTCALRHYGKKIKSLNSFLENLN